MRLNNQLRSSASVHSIVHLILYALEELPCGGCILIVVHTGGIDIRQFLVEASFRQTYLPNFSQQMFKVVFTKKSSVLHTLAIKHITTDNILAQHIRCSLAKLGSANEVGTIAYRNNSIKVVILCTIILAISSSSSEFPTN